MICHIAVYTTDLTGMRDFFVRYFGAVSNDGYHNERTDFRSFFLSFGEGVHMEIMSRPDVSGGDIPNRCGYHHVAFSLGSREAVDTLTERLRADGYEVLSGPRVTGDGYYESCVSGFEGVVVELTE